MLFLPEISDFVTADNGFSLHVATTLENSHFMKEVRTGAKENNLWVSVGVHESTNSQSKVYNTHVIIDNEGQIKSAYRKLHVSNGDVESAITLGGDQINDIVQTPIGKLGLGVGHDLRFPELSIALRQRGAELLAYPSAFTVHEGMDHWGKYFWNVFCRYPYLTIFTKRNFNQSKSNRDSNICVCCSSKRKTK